MDGLISGMGKMRNYTQNVGNFTPGYELPRKLNEQGVENLTYAFFELCGKDYRKAKEYLMRHNADFRILKSHLAKARKAREKYNITCGFVCNTCLSKCEFKRNEKKWENRLHTYTAAETDLRLCGNCMPDGIRERLDHIICDSKYENGGYPKCEQCTISSDICRIRLKYGNEQEQEDRTNTEED